MSYDPPNHGRAFGALFWISAAVALVCGIVIDGALALANPRWVIVNGVGNAIGMAGVAALFALPFCFVSGAFFAPIAPPIFRRIGLASLHGYVAGGAVCGALALTLIALMFVGWVPQWPGQLGLGLLPGGVAGCLWWLAVEQPRMRTEQNG